jgi:uncharacterized protein YndB with AHSA1/START domain
VSDNDTETLEAVAGRSVLRLERHLPHRPEKVWRAVTEPEHLAAWFPSNVEIPELTVGGKVRFVFTGEEAPPDEGTITQLDEPRLFAFTWGGNELRIELTPSAEDEGGGEGCTLVFTQVFDDTPSAASYASGWDQRLAALAASLSGTEAAKTDIDASHEAFVRQFGLDQGTAVDTPGGGWEVRFERQLVRPGQTVWDVALGGDAAPATGGPVPAGFIANGLDAGPVTEVDAPTSLAYEWRHEGEAAGQVTWALAEGTGHGALLKVTQSGPADLPEARAAALAAWRDRIEALTQQLLQVPHPTRG